MSTPIDGGKLFAIPLMWNMGNPEKNTKILDWVANHSHWFAADMSAEEARLTAAWMLTDADSYKWEIWRGGTLAGVILLSQVTPKVDAVFHFTLFPASETAVTLFGARRLLWNFLGRAFEMFHLQRISAEIPEDRPKLVSYFRRRLAFSYEGELDLDRLRRNSGLIRGDVSNAATWVAGQGSRREAAHWNGTKWSDLILLRLLRSEYITRASLGEVPQTTRGTPTGIPDVTKVQEGQV